MFSVDLFKHLRCVEVEIREGVELHHFEFEHVSYEGGEDSESDHVVWIPVFILSSRKDSNCIQYNFNTLSSLGDLISPFLPYPLLWDLPAGMTMHDYLKFLSVPVENVEH